jgi:GNAT superfamily N-acetyltransferase
MPGSFRSTPFNEVSLGDVFFDSLREDYPGFDEWFTTKGAVGEAALVHRDDEGIGAFVYLKEEDETVGLVDGALPAAPRLKIGTLKVAARVQGERLGEGAIGLALWRWRKIGCNQIYVTVFEKHASLVGMLGKFGFAKVGMQKNGESVYLKDRRRLDYSDPYRCFPFIDPAFTAANLLVIIDDFHDQLFPYSELANQFQESFQTAAANGVTKTYVGAAASMAVKPGQPLLIYRRHAPDDGQRGFKSAITSYCMATDVVQVKHEGRELESFEDFMRRVKNKSVFGDDELADLYHGKWNLMVVEMVYLGYFGPGHNVNWRWLSDNGYWRAGHPNQTTYTRAEFKSILERGEVDVEALVVHQP